MPISIEERNRRWKAEGRQLPFEKKVVPMYYGSEWTTALEVAMERTQNLCQRCQKARALQVHHIIPVTSFENPNDAHYQDNLLPVCLPCHKQIHKEMKIVARKNKLNITT